MDEFGIEELVSDICDRIARYGYDIDPDIGNPKFAKLYDDISGPIRAVLEERSERGWE